MKKFAFMIHPRVAEDIGRRAGKMLRIGEDLGMKLLPEGPSEWLVKRLPGRLGFTVCSHFYVRDQAEGWIIAILLTGKQMRTLPIGFVQKRIIDGIIYAQDVLGVERVGLGAYTAPMTKNGLAVVSDPRIKISVTHGDALSAASGVEAVMKVAALRNITIESSTIAVVGSYGIVGRLMSIILSELGPKKLILTGPRPTMLNKLKNEAKLNYHGEIFVSNDNSVIKEADIVILTTTSIGDIVSPETMKDNAIVIDMAQPHNMGKDVCLARPDILRVDGGYMSIPGINLRFRMGPPRETTFACLTETIMSILIDDKENHVGQVDMGFARQVYGMAKSVGFELAPLTNFSQPIFGQSVEPFNLKAKDQAAHSSAWKLARQKLSLL